MEENDHFLDLSDKIKISYINHAYKLNLFSLWSLDIWSKGL